MSDELSDKAVEVALGPKSATVDGNTVVAQDIDEIKKAKQLAASDSAAARPHFGLRMTQLVPGSTG